MRPPYDLELITTEFDRGDQIQRETAVLVKTVRADSPQRTRRGAEEKPEIELVNLS
jgi:hypothetical protein